MDQNLWFPIWNAEINIHKSPRDKQVFFNEKSVSRRLRSRQQTAAKNFFRKNEVQFWAIRTPKVEKIGSDVETIPILMKLY